MNGAKHNYNSNIILCGFMGCGKSTVATLLAERTGRELADTDHLIEAKIGMSISKYFERFGEPAFRAIEREVCLSLREPRGLIISCGGGAIMDERNVQALSQGGVIVLLDVPPDVILERLSGDSSRPLLAGGDRKEKLYALYNKRISLYRAAADVIIDADRPAEEVSFDISSLWEDISNDS
ncbi:MAG: shikimate kinase [Oscillospiraceae bacterium]|jgi:shikimate kinase|nr:shikimate kinase [Oscillospiraceae bacterium]